MEWTEWLRNYHRDHMEEYLREEMQECGLPGEIHKEKAFMGKKEVDRYWVEIADGILLEGICFEDIQKLCESSEKDVEPEELIKVLCEGWTEEYRFMEENRQTKYRKPGAIRRYRW